MDEQPFKLVVGQEFDYPVQLPMLTDKGLIDYSTIMSDPDNGFVAYESVEKHPNGIARFYVAVLASDMSDDDTILAIVETDPSDDIRSAYQKLEAAMDAFYTQQLNKRQQ